MTAPYQERIRYHYQVTFFVSLPRAAGRGGKRSINSLFPGCPARRSGRSPISLESARFASISAAQSLDYSAGMVEIQQFGSSPLGVSDMQLGIATLKAARSVRQPTRCPDWAEDIWQMPWVFNASL